MLWRWLKGLVGKRINPNCLDFLSRQTQHQCQWFGHCTVLASFYSIVCLFPFNFEYWKYQEYWKCNKVFKSSNILQECQYSHYWKNNLCDFSHLKMSKNFTWKMHLENAINNFSDFFLQIIAYLASHCRAKPHYLPTKVTIGEIVFTTRQNASKMLF